jgi:hypothetical protein
VGHYMTSPFDNRQYAIGRRHLAIGERRLDVGTDWRRLAKAGTSSKKGGHGI